MVLSNTFVNVYTYVFKSQWINIHVQYTLYILLIISDIQLFINDIEL